jgi:flavin reductase (DIM6/NTAB) family NADH-FMN oxidoreductase RutF/rubredoxin
MGASVFDPKALYQLGYGLYVLTTRNGEKDNGCIVNTVMQVASTPLIIAVGVNKQNYTCEIIQKTGILNINSLTEDTPFDVFKHFGYQSGRDVNKFDECTPNRSENGLIVLPKHIKGFLSLAVDHETDLGSHMLFLCRPTEGKLLSDGEAVTYSYYQKNIKPNPQPEKKKGFVCRICGYVYEGETLPEDFVCPLCKHGAKDFEPI